MSYQYFKTMKGFITLQEDWRNHRYFTDEEREKIIEQNILTSGTPVIVDEYGIDCVPIKKQIKAIIDDDCKSILFLNEGKKTISYLSDFGVYDDIGDALLDITENEFVHIVNIIIGAHGAIYNAATQLADIGYKFNLERSQYDKSESTYWYNGSIKLTINFNKANIIHHISLDSVIGLFDKDFTAEDYNVNPEYAKEYMGLKSIVEEDINENKIEEGF